MLGNGAGPSGSQSHKFNLKFTVRQQQGSSNSGGAAGGSWIAAFRVVLVDEYKKLPFAACHTLLAACQ